MNHSFLEHIPYCRLFYQLAIGMNQVVLLLVLFIGIILLFALSSNIGEGFNDNVLAAINTGKQEVNPVAELCAKPPCDITDATNSISGSTTYTASTAAAIPLATLVDISMCETRILSGSITPDICDSVFADPEFANKCGVSIANGTTMSGKRGWAGGLYLSPNDKMAQFTKANIIAGVDTNIYTPSEIGSAASPLFATDAATCKRMVAEHTCGAGVIGTNQGDYTCALCYGDNTKHAIKTKGSTSPLLFTFFTNALGKGTTCTLSVTGAPFIDFNTQPLPKQQIDSETNIPFYAISTDKLTVKEGANFTLTVSNPTKTAFIGGYLQSTTVNSNSYRIDINSFVTAANGEEDGTLQNYITYAQSASAMTLTGTIPFTFISPSSYDTTNCKTGPFISMEQSAKELSAGGGCYSPDATPGNYPVECLQTTFTGVGGSKKGTGYPQTMADTSNIQQLLYDAKGNPRTLNSIVSYLSTLSSQASTGMKDGKSMSMYDWNKVSLYMTGIAVADPCDSANPGFKGPFSQECYNYLYTSSSTYVPKSMANQTSLDSDGKTALTCRPEGGLNPARPEGLARAKTAADKGGKQAIIDLYTNTFYRANDVSKSTRDPDRAQAMNDCYGITSVQKQNPEVYQVTIYGSYPYKYEDGPGICSALGATVATPDQVFQSQQAGAQTCGCGWTTDKNTIPYPMQQEGLSGCASPRNNANGQPIIAGECYDWRTNSGKDFKNATAAVWCYGPKPPEGTPGPNGANIAPFQIFANSKDWKQGTTTVWNNPYAN
jgi:Extracellular link domain